MVEVGGQLYLFGGYTSTDAGAPPAPLCGDVRSSCGRGAGSDATFMGDLWRFTPWASTWTDLSGASPVNDPGARAYHGLVSAGQTVYLFGGSSEQGEDGLSLRASTGWTVVPQMGIVGVRFSSMSP